MRNEDISDDDLKLKLEFLKNELGGIEYSIAQVENELFYRKYPETRPKESTHENS